MKKMVLASPEEPFGISVPTTLFGRDKKGNVYTRRVVKKNKIAYRKSWIHEHRMYPYGYTPSAAVVDAEASADEVASVLTSSPPSAKVARYRPVTPTEDPSTPCCSKSLLVD